MSHSDPGLPSRLHPQFRFPDGTREFFVEKLEAGLAGPRPARIPYQALLDRLTLIWNDEDPQLILETLERRHTPPHVLNHAWGDAFWQQRPLPDGEWEPLADVLSQLLESAETLSARDRDKVDRAISRMSRRLPIGVAWRMLGHWLWDQAERRRRTAIRILFEHGIPDDLARPVIDLWKERQDPRLYALLRENPQAAAQIEEADVLAILAQPEPEDRIGPFMRRDPNAFYWKMRTVELVFIGGNIPSEALAFEYPNEFVAAATRFGHQESVTRIRQILESHSGDPEIVWRCSEACETLGEPDDLERVWQVAAGIVAAKAATNTDEAVESK
jgi:hypothetical protein